MTSRINRTGVAIGCALIVFLGAMCWASTLDTPWSDSIGRTPEYATTSDGVRRRVIVTPEARRLYDEIIGPRTVFRLRLMGSAQLVLGGIGLTWLCFTGRKDGTRRPGANHDAQENH